MTCQSLPPEAMLSEEAQSREAERAASLWTVDPLPSGDPEDSAASMQSHAGGSNNDSDHPAFQLSSDMPSGRDSLERAANGSSSSSNKKGGPTSSAKSMIDRLKSIFKRAITHCELRYVKADELIFDDVPLEVGEEVTTPTSPDSGSSSSSTDEGDGSGHSSDNTGSDDHSAGARTQHTETDWSSADDGYNETVSMSASSIDDNCDGGDNDLVSCRSSASCGDVACDSKAENCSDLRIPICLTPKSAMSDDSSMDVDSGGSPVVVVNKPMGRREAEAMERYTLLSSGKPSAVRPKDSCTALPVLKSSVGGVSKSAQAGSSRFRRSSALLKPASRPPPDDVSAASPRDGKQKRKREVTAPEDSPPRGTYRLANDAEVLDIKSAHLIKGVVAVKPSRGGVGLRQSKLIKLPREPKKLLVDEGTEAVKDKSKGARRASGDKHSVQLTRSGLFGECMGELGDKHKLRLATGVHRSAKVPDLLTIPKIGEATQAASKTPSSDSVAVTNDSAPSQDVPATTDVAIASPSANASDKQTLEPAKDDSFFHRRHYSGRRIAACSGNLRTALVRDLHEGIPLDKYNRKFGDDRYDHSRSLRRHDDAHLSHRDKDDWDHNSPVTRDESPSQSSVGDTNLVNSHVSYRVVDRSFDGMDDYDARSVSSWRSIDYGRERDYDYYRRRCLDRYDDYGYCDRYGYEGSRYGPECDRYSSDRDRYGYEGSRYGPEGDRYGADRDRYATDWERHAPGWERRGGYSSDFHERDRPYRSRYRPDDTGYDAPRYYGGR
ncbi:23S rRNA (guanosine(2251)-2'-O)-methyltransferase RlmB [Babesia caballi]|uniref:23S rRNA (Guanosine(2251)-2'-O)-methyltransferase RlmB n=1 Tax=Babesia caballi TaxID=5871 RepID=A0AAV4LMF2_BABCB|nr:23S rRNA (guanosine(2251)-2'-O)-methyltransferase RlmB [Babesia caballi]